MTAVGASVFATDDLDWDDLSRTGRPAAMTEGVRRKLLAQGQGSFYVQYVEMVPGHRVHPHSHDHDEVIIVAEGGATVDGVGTVSARDCVVMSANQEYSFTVGPDGMAFYIVRTGDAQMSLRA